MNSMRSNRIITALAIMALAVAGICSCNPSENQEAPELKVITSALQTTYNAEGGEGSFSFQITNPRGDGKFSAMVQDGCDWITDITVESFRLTGTVSFRLETWEGNEDRNAEITVIYTYGNGKTTTVKADIIQEAGTYDYNLTAETALISYDDFYKNIHYCILLLGVPSIENGKPDNIRYYLSIATKKSGADKSLQPGIYAAGDSDLGINDGIDGIFDYYCSYFLKSDKNGEDAYDDIVQGSLIVEKGTGDTYTITGNFLDNMARTHKIVYTGAIPFVDNSGN